MSKNLGPTDLKRLHRSWRQSGTTPLAVALDDVQGPFNVGTVVRTAAAERVDHLWLAGSTAAPTSTKAQRTGMGCERLVPWTMTADIDEAVAAARAAGLRIIGLELTDDAVPLHELDLTIGVCLVAGHEDRGLSHAALAACDSVGFVPQLGRVGSLNVAQAVGMAIYEVRRQGWVRT